MTVSRSEVASQVAARLSSLFQSWPVESTAVGALVTDLFKDAPLQDPALLALWQEAIEAHLRDAILGSLVVRLFDGSFFTSSKLERLNRRVT